MPEFENIWELRSRKSCSVEFQLAGIVAGLKECEGDLVAPPHVMEPEVQHLPRIRSAQPSQRVHPYLSIGSFFDACFG
jgi:hypothetical protein